MNTNTPCKPASPTSSAFTGTATKPVASQLKRIDRIKRGWHALWTTSFGCELLAEMMHDGRRFPED